MSYAHSEHVAWGNKFLFSAAGFSFEVKKGSSDSSSDLDKEDKRVYRNMSKVINCLTNPDWEVDRDPCRPYGFDFPAGDSESWRAPSIGNPCGNRVYPPFKATD